jgi:hypothetical protein
MKKAPYSILLAAVVTLLSAPVLAQPSDASPLLGSWAVDTTKLPMPPESRPKSVTITHGEAGAGKWTMKVAIVAGDGAAITAVGTYSLDGTPSPVEGSPEADTAAVKMPVPNVLILALAKGGVPASTRIYSTAPDGKTMIETAVYFDRDGKPIMRTNYFNRIP